MIPILVAPSAFQLQTPITPPTKNTVEVYLELPKSSFPDQTQNYTQTIVQPCQARGGTISGYACVIPPPPPPTPIYASEPATEAPVASQVLFGSLIGSLGYSLAYGNCVDEPGVNNPGWGNPLSWGITSNNPWIGASALFYFNHVAVVTGIWSNGDVEVAQQNSPGMPHRISPNLIRGYR